MGYTKKTPSEKIKTWDAVTWLKSHPEDIFIAYENLAARDRGFDNEGVRELFAAISLRACTDYKLALDGVCTNHADPKLTEEECHKFFDSDIFQFFINRIPVHEVEKILMETPKGELNERVKNMR